MIKQDLQNLKQQDLYSLILFALYKIKDVPEYSSLSELSYVLDKPNLLNLCEYFGGTTIKIPTLSELETLIHSLLMYQNVEIEHKDLEDYCESLELSNPDINIKNIKKGFKSIVNILKDYTFDLREPF